MFTIIYKIGRDMNWENSFSTIKSLSQFRRRRKIHHFLITQGKEPVLFLDKGFYTLQDLEMKVQGLRASAKEFLPDHK